jgi:hypothetical protein
VQEPWLAVFVQDERDGDQPPPESNILQRGRCVMHRLGKIEIEPLTEQRWSEIETSLFAELDAERLDAEPAPKSEEAPRRWRARPAAVLVMAGAMAAAIGAIAGRTLWTSPLAPAASAPASIVTGESDSKVALGESEIDVAPDSAVLVSGDDDRGVLVVLDHGKVDCEVAPRTGRPAFVVQAGDVRVRVVGTRFAVERDAHGPGAHVLVAHGIVEVTSHGHTMTLRDGESWPSEATASAAAVAAAAPVAATDVSPPAPTSRTPARRDTTSSRGSKPSATIARTLPDDPAPLPASLASTSPTLGATEAPAPTPPSPQELYEAAARMEGQNPDGALGIYRRLSSGSGPWAANALYAAGRLQADRGRKADAQRLLGEYLTRYPNGANAGDARDLLARVR